MSPTRIEVVTGSDAFILTGSNNEQKVDISNPVDKELRLTITICWEEYRDPTQPAGSLWLEYSLGKNTPSMSGGESVVPIENMSPKDNYFVVATRGLVSIHYTGQAEAHVRLSYYAEIPQ